MPSNYYYYYYAKDCVTRPILPSLVGAGLFSAIDVATGTPTDRAVRNVGKMYHDEIDGFDDECGSIAASP